MRNPPLYLACGICGAQKRAAADGDLDDFDDLPDHVLQTVDMTSGADGRGPASGVGSSSAMPHSSAEGGGRSGLADFAYSGGRGSRGPGTQITSGLPITSASGGASSSSAAPHRPAVPVASSSNASGAASGRPQPAAGVADDEPWNPGDEPGVYVIECKDGSIYVGAAENLARRIAQHHGGQSSAWVKLHGGVRRVLRPEEPPHPDLDSWEQRELANQVILHGVDNVRGWEISSTTQLTEKDLHVVKVVIFGKHQACRKCGNKGHFMRACTPGKYPKAEWLADIERRESALQAPPPPAPPLPQGPQFLRGPQLDELMRRRNVGGADRGAAPRSGRASAGRGSSGERKRPRDLSSSAAGPTCGRCGRPSGRNSYCRPNCFYRTTIDGVSLPPRCKTCLSEGHTAKDCGSAGPLGRRCDACDDDISDHHPSHTLCSSCWEEDDEEEEDFRGCDRCGIDISDRPPQYTLCYPCWRANSDLSSSDSDASSSD